MGSLVKLGPGCRQNTERRTQNSEPSPWTPEYSSPPLPSSSCASSTPAPASNVTSATHTTTSTAATPSTSRTHPMSRRHKSSWPIAPQMAKNTSAGKSTRTCAVTRGSSGAAGTRRTPRAATATPPCWRSTTRRSAPATRTAATPPACSASPLPCRLLWVWPTCFTRPCCHRHPDSPMTTITTATTTTTTTTTTTSAIINTATTTSEIINTATESAETINTARCRYYNYNYYCALLKLQQLQDYKSNYNYNCNCCCAKSVHYQLQVMPQLNQLNSRRNLHKSTKVHKSHFQKDLQHPS